MSEPLRITLVTSDLAIASAIEPIVAQEAETVLTVEARGIESLAWSAGATPHAVIVVDRDGRGQGLEELGRLRSLPRFVHCRMLLLRPRLEAGDGVLELNSGVHDFLTLPIVPAEVTSRLRALADQHRLHETLSEERARVDHLNVAFHTGFDQIIRLLIRLVDLHFPGAEARGASVAALAMRMAARFKIPERFLRDLELAARLHELGRMVLSDGHGEDDERDRRPALNPGAASLASRALLQDVDGLKGVAEVLSAVYENWDGTGVPDRSIQGQIPLRSRVLRVAMDYLSAIEARPEAVEAVLERLDEHAGTRYDPLVLAHLHAALSEDGGPILASANHHVAIEKLRVGMVLAEDLYTDAGLKLLTRGTSLTPSSLDTILRRHRMEPILRGAVVERAAA